jgi:uncharacterized protein (DUF488 family)
VNVIHSLGHSTHPIERFIGLLKQQGIELLADVRSVPYSKFNPQFRQKELRTALEAAGISYLYLGEALGGKPYLPYAERVWMELFQAGLNTLKNLAADKRACIMCAEKEPLNCHRTLLISRALSEQNIPVMHILADGKLKPHAEVEANLLDWVELGEGQLFDGPAARLDEAYARRRTAGNYRR